jgi:hypothetical protein
MLVLLLGSLGLLRALWTIGSLLALSLVWFRTGRALSISLQLYAQNIGEHLRQCAVDGIEWHDVYSTHDLVPMGRRSGLAGQGFVRQYEVDNQRSYLHDHTSYFTNRLGFIPRLVDLIAKHSRLRPQLKPDESDIDRMQLMHRRRVWVLHASLLATLASYIAVVLARTDLLIAIGHSIRRVLRAASLNVFLSPVDTFGTAVAAIVARGGVTVNVVDGLWIGDVVLGLVAVAAVTLAWWIAFRAAWVAGDLTDFHRIVYVRPILFEQGILGDWRSTFAWIGIGVIVPLVVVVAIVFAVH